MLEVPFHIYFLKLIMIEETQNFYRKSRDKRYKLYINTIVTTYPRLSSIFGVHHAERER